ncbi:ATP-binding protein [Permianibacter aggregans]|uniref:histidine kinase n=1 Tax=Permianibacter aggregans TaxID=1510150 RepID=A0A4R6UMP2_9GAMM|nr:ATP-binding protein [Permianibacter aggregans]QGX40814.1 response regulator [Permianibacter aggregans]TDQ48368.1 signal transduction histidine kinase [Permianibacter aggregans]
MAYRGRKQLLTAGIIYLLGVILVTVIWLRFLQKNTLDTIDQRLLNAAAEVADVLPADFHDRATSAASVTRDEDKRNLEALSSHARLAGFAYLYTYVLKNNLIYFTASSYDDDDVESGTVSYYWTPYPEAHQGFFDAYHDNKITYATYTDRWGTFRTVLLPRTSPGGQRYVVGADIDISEIDDALWSQVPWVVGAALLLLAFAVPMAFTMRRTLEKINADLRQLNQALESDLAERERVEHELRTATEKANVANESKSRFLANMSHEMRTPLNGISGMTELLLDTPLGETQREYAERIQQCSQALLETIHHVLDVASIESGHARFQYRSIDIREWLDEHLSVFALTIARQQIDLAVEVSVRTPRLIQMDPERLWQVLGNLIGNAIKYTERGGVHVHLDWHDHQLFVEVEDSGIGIPLEHQESIFDAFAQADTSATRRHEGSGLGLTLARDLCRLMGGKLWLERSTPLGSLFSFKLPAGAEDSLSTVFMPTPRMRIAVVSDFVPYVQQMHYQLGPHGISLLRLNDVNALLNFEPDAGTKAIIIDSKFGGEALTLCRQKAGADLTLIWLHWIGEETPELASEPLRRLCKPLSAQNLKQVLAEFLPAGAAPISEEESHKMPVAARILVAEDNLVNQTIIMRMLALAGMQADAVDNGLAAVFAVREKRYDVVLMDIQMPELDGLQATQMILAEKGRDAPLIIGLSAHATLDQIDDARRAGMQEYLTKPVRRETLIATLRRVLERRVNSEVPSSR